MSYAVPRVEPRPSLFWAATALLICNLLDGVFTLAAVYAGAATEANPLMSASLHWGAVSFILVKTSLVSLGVLLLWRRRQRLLAAGGLFVLSALYAGIVLYHVSSLGQWVTRLG